MVLCVTKSRTKLGSKVLFGFFGLLTTQHKHLISDAQLDIAGWLQKNVGFVVVLDLLTSIEADGNHLLIQDECVIQFPECFLLEFGWHGYQEQIALLEFHFLVDYFGLLVDVGIPEDHLIENARDEGIVEGLTNESVEHGGDINLSGGEWFTDRPTILLHVIVA